MKVYLYDVFHRCDSITDWVSFAGTLSLSSTQKVEGKYSIKLTSDDFIASSMKYVRTVDWSEFEDIIFSVYHPGWTNERGLIEIGSGVAHYKTWNFDFAASWTEITIDLSSTPDHSEGTLDLSNIIYIRIYEDNAEDPGEDYYFDFFRGRSIEVSDYVEDIRIKGGIFPIRKVGSFMTHPDHAHYFTKKNTLKICDDSDNTIFLGVITDKNRSLDGLYRYAMVSYFNEAHILNYVKSFSSDKSSEKIQDVIDNSFNHIYRSASILATVLDYDYSLNRQSAALINMIRFLEREVISIAPDGLMKTEAYDGLTKAPQYFGATYNFRDDAVGDEPAGWTIVKDADCTANIIASLDGHKKVLELSDDNGAGYVYALIGNVKALNLTYEFYFTKNSIAANTTGAVRMWEGGISITRLRFAEDDLEYYDGAWKSIKAAFLVANTLVRIKIVFNDAANTFDCYIDGVLEKADAAYENNSVSGVDYFRLDTDISDTGYKIYLEALGVSNDPNYNVGDNAVAWDVNSHHQSVMLINAKDIKGGYYKGSLGITRASVRMAGNVIRTKPDNRADTEQAIGVNALKEYRDLKLVDNTAADQLATNLFNVFSLETEFIALRVRGEGFLPPGQTLNVRNTGSIPIAEGDFCIISFIYAPKSDVYLEMIVSNNIVLPSEFTSNFDTSPLQIHQANLQTFENATDIATKGNIKTGTYEGTAVNNRQITGFGFTPKSIILVWHSGINNMYYKDDSMGAWIVHKADPAGSVDNMVKFIADGIEVDNNNNDSNWNGHTYTYTAFG